MIEQRKNKIYDLEERTLKLARETASFAKRLPRTITNQEYIGQLIRSSSSVGANYIEANESLGKKDFLMRIKISRKEAKESMYWLKLIDVAENGGEEGRKTLLDEAGQLTNIFGSIVRKVEKTQ